MFAGSTNLLITGGNFTHIQGDIHATELNLLQQAASPNAFYDSGHDADPPKCLPNTREAIQKRIMNWSQSSNAEFVVWVKGSAGVGKTAIARSIAERCDEQGTLLAAFFFSRARNDVACFVATIAYQMVLKIPESLPEVCATIKRNPLIFRLVLDTQFRELIIEPLKRLVDSGCDMYSSPGAQHVIILDGLDECQDAKSQVNILKIFATLLPQSPIPIRLLVASRPEQQIIAAFEAAPLDNATNELDINKEFSSYSDIRIFFNTHFAEIKATHQVRKHIPSDWPSSSTLYTLADKASGQFIYASTVMKYVASPYHNPVDRLDDILSMGSTAVSPLAEVDALYHGILSRIHHPWSEIRKVVTPILLYPGISLDELEAFFLYKPGNIRLRLTDLSSVISVEEDYHGFTYGRVYHASFYDFLMDPNRSKELNVFDDHDHTAILRRCLEILRQRKPYEYRIALRLLLNHLPYSDLNQVREDFIYFNFPGFRFLRETSSLSAYFSYLDGSFTLASRGTLEILAPDLHRSQQEQFYSRLRADLQTYYNRPKLTFLLVLTMHYRKLFSISRDRINVSDGVAQLDPTEKAFDQKTLMLSEYTADPFADRARRYLAILESCFRPASPNTPSLPGDKVKLPGPSKQHYASATIVALKYVQSHVEYFRAEREETSSPASSREQRKEMFNIALDVISLALPLCARSEDLVRSLREARVGLAVIGLDAVFPWYLAKAKEQIRIFG